MSTAPAHSSSAIWFLASPTSPGMHAGMLTFIATTPGTFQYRCPGPGHARKSMVDAFTVVD